MVGYDNFRNGRHTNCIMTELKGKDLLVNIAQTKPKTKEEAKLETHNEFIDIQIPLSGTEIMGYTAAKDCVPADAPYNAEKDITFFEGLAETYVAVKPGMFAIFFPQDGHAPGITPDLSLIHIYYAFYVLYASGIDIYEAI